MKLPNAEAAEVSEEKITAYLLNPVHVDGAGKAKFFAGFGYSISNWEVLAADLRQLALVEEITSEKASAHGQKYVIDGPLQTPSGRVIHVRTVWIIDRGGQRPRLVTAYPGDEGE